ncbi:MAG: TlpA family protein disulfide reductase [Muribaculaceae bacterium]|nr:TlpA family protein disulfide reductase [Muribaculaceae bacterium]
MKKFSLAFALLMSIGLTSFDVPAKTVVDFPYYKFNSTQMLDIRRVETDDDSVTVYADLYSRPDEWVRIASGAYIKGNKSEKVLPLAAIEGIELDKEVYPGKPGRIPFIMKFGALAPEDDSFDFIEGDDPGAFIVKEICIDMPLTAGDVICHLEGTVDDPSLSRMIVTEADEDFRTVSHFVSIPVTDGHFSYDFYADKDTYYSLYPYHQFIDGAWSVYNFFAYDGTVNFHVADVPRPRVLSDNPAQKIQAASEARRQEVYNYLDSVEKSIGKENMLSPEGRELRKQIGESEGDERRALIDKFRNGDYYSDAYKAYRALGDSLRNVMVDEELASFAAQPSLYALIRTYENLSKYVPEESRAKYGRLYDSLLADYRPDYYMHEKIRRRLRSELLDAGKPYIDYEITAADGNKVKYSELADGKVTLVDLWASWCGPCRRLSMSYIPVYEKFKDDGLNVISIARESDAASMAKAVVADGYPWQTYLELNDENKIWEKHGAHNSGGTSFLIGKDGTILLVHPSAEEVDALLTKMKAENKL